MGAYEQRADSRGAAQLESTLSLLCTLTTTAQATLYLAPLITRMVRTVYTSSFSMITEEQRLCGPGIPPLLLRMQ